MSSPKVLVLRAPGINCERETHFAFARAGASPVDGRWSVVAPAATELVLPVLPWAPATLQPSSGDTTGTSVRLVGGSDGYPGLRAFALTPSLDRFAGPGRLITSGLAVAE